MLWEMNWLFDWFGFIIVTNWEIFAFHLIWIEFFYTEFTTLVAETVNAFHFIVSRFEMAELLPDENYIGPEI